MTSAAVARAVGSVTVEVSACRAWHEPKALTTSVALSIGRQPYEHKPGDRSLKVALTPFVFFVCGCTKDLWP